MIFKNEEDKNLFDAANAAIKLRGVDTPLYKSSLPPKKESKCGKCVQRENGGGVEYYHKCPSCHEWKIVWLEFTRSQRNKHQSWCKKCNKENRSNNRKTQSNPRTFVEKIQGDKTLNQILKDLLDKSVSLNKQQEEVQMKIQTLQSIVK